MHSCEVAVAAPPPIQGTALLLELGTLIIEGRSSQLDSTATISQLFRLKDESTHTTSYGQAANGNEQEPKNGDFPSGPSYDVHSRVLAAKLFNVKNFQRSQFRKSCEDDDKTKTCQGAVQNVDRKPRSLLQGRAEALWKEQIPLCIDVLLAPQCGVCLGQLMLLERWTMSIHCKGSNPSNHITSQWLLNAVRSQLHFSQLSAWSSKLREEQKAGKEDSPTERQRKLSRETCNFKKYESNCDEEELLKQERLGHKSLNVIFNIKMMADDHRVMKFKSEPTKHTFPITDIGSNVFLMVTLEALPRVDEIPVIQCTCSNLTSTLKRRRSRDMVNTPDEVLAHTLANVCSLGENSAHSSDGINMEQKSGLVEDLKVKLRSSVIPCTDSGAINPDKGCSSGISRKLSAYSMPNNSGALYSPPTPSRGTTPDGREGSSTCGSALGEDTNTPLHKGECSYHDAQVPSVKVYSNNYLVVDDRMQTPCGQKGKHRCNCDDESDHGSHLRESSHHSGDKGTNSFYNVPNRCKVSQGAEERRAQETARHLRRLRKEAKMQQMRGSGHSSKEHSESNLGEAVEDARSRHNDLNGGVAACRSQPLDEPNSTYEVNTISKIPKPSGCSISKVSEHHPTTSIPILQASRFEHAIRYGSYRSCVPFHGSVQSKDSGPVSRELKCACSSVGCDQMASVKTCRKASSTNQVVDNNFNNTLEVNTKPTCRTFTTCCNFCNSDDNYRPVVKKMISSCTQTDDFKCDCGKALVPKCLECSRSTNNSIEREGQESNQSKMKRTWGTHDLVGIDKSALLLEAIERPSRVSESQKEDADTGIDAMVYCDIKAGGEEECDVLNNKDKCSNNQVIENKCDSSLIRDKGNELYTSCNHRTDSGGNHSHHRTAFNKFTLAGNIDKAINFIRRPRLKRFMPIVDKLDKIVMERSHEKRKSHVVLTEPVDTRNITFEMKRTSHLNLTKDPVEYGADEGSEDLSPVLFDEFSNYNNNNGEAICYKHLVVLDKCNYGDGSYGCMETKHGEKHSFEENERSCKHFRSESEVRVIETDFSDALSSSSCYKQNGCKEIQEASLNTQVDHYSIPSTSEMDKFRWRLDSAASMVFHSRTGLPLTSSPAPLRRGKSSFDYDSTINSVSSIKSALYGTDLEPDQCSSLCSPGSSPGSPLFWDCASPPLLLENVASVISEKDNTPCTPTSYSNISNLLKHSKRNKFRHGTTSGLLGSFEESVLNGRLEPAATVVGFTAEIGASGSFCPQHLKLPVTVFFYSLGDNTTSAPYLGHINLGRKGYNVPKAGTIQVTLFNPHGTVVKMFVVMYDMADMPPYSKTFLRQKTLCVPAVNTAQPTKQDPHALRYLIHLRFFTSKSGKVYLHTDIRIIVSRRADMDTAQTLKPAINLNSQNSKKKTVETGTFTRRYPKNVKQSSPSSCVNGVTAPKEVIRKPKVFTLPPACNGSNVFSDGSVMKLPIAYYDHSHKDNEDDTEDVQDGRIRRRSDSMDGLPKELSYELRSYTYGPDNPKYSPR